MTNTVRVVLALSLVPVVLGLAGRAQAQQAAMTFFVTSVGSGKGADLGGLAGADQLCQKLPAAVGAGGRT